MGSTRSAVCRVTVPALVLGHGVADRKPVYMVMGSPRAGKRVSAATSLDLELDGSNSRFAQPF